MLNNLTALSFLLNIIALIPLSEFSDPIIAKKYGAKPDIETLDLLNTTATQKEASTPSLWSCYLPFPSQCCFIEVLSFFWQTDYGGCESPVGRSAWEALSSYPWHPVELLGYRKQGPWQAQEVVPGCSQTVLVTCGQLALLSSLIAVLIFWYLPAGCSWEVSATMSWTTQPALSPSSSHQAPKVDLITEMPECVVIIKMVGLMKNMH